MNDVSVPSAEPTEPAAAMSRESLQGMRSRDANYGGALANLPVAVEDRRALLKEVDRLTAALAGYRATWHVANGHDYPISRCQWTTCMAIELALPVAPIVVPWTCEKCGGQTQRTQWHEGGFGRLGCGFRDITTTSGEHLHHYCETCHFDWSTPVLSAPQVPTQSGSPESPVSR